MKYPKAVLAVGAVSVVAAASPSVAAPKPTCQEDMACWTWSTMGDKQRGVTLKSGTRLVVGPHRFCLLVKAKRIDWKRSEHLRGDNTACKAVKA